MHRRGARIYYSVAPSRLYAEPKRLERLGYVRSEKRPGKTRERTFYTLAGKGREALRSWALEPPAFPRIQDEAVLKLMCGDIVEDDEQLLRSLLALRDEIEAEQKKRNEARQRYEGLPHRKRYLLLNHELGTRLLQVHSEWLDLVERELTRPNAAQGSTASRIPSR